jgi:hypothetical protein
VKLAVALLGVMLVPGAAVMSGIAAAAPQAVAPMAPTVPMAPRAPSMPRETDIQVARQPTLKSCNRQADAKSLTGKERATFVQDCQAGRIPLEATPRALIDPAGFSL